MKKLLLAASLIAAISPAFSQSVIGNSGANNHGQGDCQCIGRGIQVNTGQDQAPTPSSGSLSPAPASQSGGQEKIEVATSPGLWYTYFELYLIELRNHIHAKSVN